MATNKSENIQHYDTRVLQRNVHDGVLTQASVKTWFETLPDVTSKSEPVRASRPGQGEDLDDDGGDEG
jgi:hypothetical protein